MCRRAFIALLASLLAVPCLLPAQSLKGYEYWFDGDFGGRKSVSLSGTASSVSAAIATDGLADGVHRLHLRVRQSGDYGFSPVSSSLFVKTNQGSSNAVEYWFDDRMDQRATVALPVVGDTCELTLPLQDAIKFPVGLHKLNLRATTDGSGLTPVVSCCVLKLPGGEADAIEYWTDDDLAHSRRVAGKAASDGNGYVFIADLDLSALSPGLHRLCYRAVNSSKQNNSAVSTVSFFKLGNGNAGKLEYWFDDDYKHRRTISGSSATGGFVVEGSLDATDIAPGHHRLSMRATNGGVTASSVSTVPVMVKPRTAADGSVTMAAYSIAIDNQPPVAYDVLRPAYEVVVPYTLDARELSKGNHTLTTSFWNSLGVGVTDQQTFSVTEPTTPAITLTAEEKNGLVTLSFNAIPRDVRSRIVRRDENGTKAMVQAYYESLYPATVSCTDNPRAGTYNYYVQCVFTDAAGTSHTLQSEEVAVTVAKAQDEVAAKQYGYITGRIACDKLTPASGLTVNFSDKVSVAANHTSFKREKIPVGTKLTMTVSGDDTHSYETATVTVAAGLNNVTIRGTLIEAQQSGNRENDLALAAPVAVVKEGDYRHFSLKVKNLSTTQRWEGLIRVKAIEKKLADKKGYDVKELSYSTKNLYSLDAVGVKLAKDETGEVKVYMQNLSSLKKDTEYYLYFESEGHFASDATATKPLALTGTVNVAANPMAMTIERFEPGKLTWGEEQATKFAYLLVGLSSVAKGINGQVGDLTPYEKDVVNAAKTLTGKRNDQEAVAAMADWLNGRDAMSILDDPVVTSLCSTIKSGLEVTARFGGKLDQKYFRDLCKKLNKLDHALIILDGVTNIVKSVTAKEPYEQCFAAANLLYTVYSAAAGSNIYGGLMHGYMVVGQALAKKALEIGNIVHDYQLADRLRLNRPYTGDKSGKNADKRNTTCDFRLVVKTGWWSKADFTKEAMQRQIDYVVIKASNTGSELATIPFTLEFQDDGIALVSQGEGSIINAGALCNVATPLKEFFMEIHWSNGRQTFIPLKEESDGIDISVGRRIDFIDGSEQDLKQSVYTITLTTATGAYNMADELYLGTNKNRK